jgi:hypothetical protein
LAPLGDAQYLVVDDGIAKEWQSKAKQAGVNLLVATLEKNNEAR